MQTNSFISGSPSERYRAGAEQVIAADDAVLEATLTLPAGARGIVVMLHASSAGRFAPAHAFTAEVLQQGGLATLQVDLLSPGEEATLPLESQRGEDVSRLAERVLAVVEWVKSQAATSELRLGLLAGKAEALPALLAAEHAPHVAAVVSEAGYPGTAQVAAPRVPSLVLVPPAPPARTAEAASEFFSRHLVG